MVVGTRAPSAGPKDPNPRQGTETSNEPLNAVGQSTGPKDRNPRQGTET